MLYYGEYAGDDKERSVYVIYNMYWETKSFDLPNLPKGKNWRVMIDSYDNTFDASLLKTIGPPRSIVIFVEDNS